MQEPSHFGRPGTMWAVPQISAGEPQILDPVHRRVVPVWSVHDMFWNR
jgi:hypothetical protein